MAKEIERKFLVSTDNWKDNVSAVHVFRQGYLSYDSERTVRVRATEVNGYLTIKGITTGLTRDEFEYEIQLEDALALLELCERPAIEKKTQHRSSWSAYLGSRCFRRCQRRFSCCGN